MAVAVQLCRLKGWDSPDSGFLPGYARLRVLPGYARLRVLPGYDRNTEEDLT